MLNEQKIIDLLTNEELSAEELKELRSEIELNPELKKLIKVVDTLEHLAKEAHFDIDTLSKYVLFLNGEITDNSEMSLIVPKIEKHIQSCATCREELEYLKAELQNVDEFLAEKISLAEMDNKADEQKIGLSIFQQYSSFKYSLAVAATIIVIFVSSFVVSELTTPSYIEISGQFNYSNFTTTRGRNSENFMKAVNQLSNENYDKAIGYFNADIKDNPNDVTIFYTYYILGITQLKDARSSVLGMFSSYDVEKLDEAEKSFEQVLKHNTSQVFQNVNNNTYFFLGQIYLLKEDLTKAKSFLNKAIENNSEYSSEAEELLNSIS